MPDPKTLERAKQDKREGKAPSTQAGEFVREEIHHIREGKHGARSPQQAIAIGLSKARRAGIELKPPARGKTSERTRRKAEQDYGRGHAERGSKRANPRRSAATSRALKREPQRSASRRSLSGQAHAAAGRRSKTQRSAAARHAARTKGRAGRSTAASKAARTRRASGRAGARAVR
jgi:hypothetical protein